VATDESKKRPKEAPSSVFENCPHCGRELSPWERVLLGVDRILMCKHCWYRIILDPPGTSEEKK
jgi:hypothetical protein